MLVLAKTMQVQQISLISSLISAVRMLGKMTGADKSWNIFQLKDFHSARTAWILMSTLEPFDVQFTTEQYLMLMFKIYCLRLYLGSVYTGYIKMPQHVIFLCTGCHCMIYTYNTNSLMFLIFVLITKTIDYTPWSLHKCQVYYQSHIQLFKECKF